MQRKTRPYILNRAPASTRQEQSPQKKAGVSKLIDETGDINIGRLPKVLTDNTDFLVVGIISGPSTGKSTLLNALLGLSPLEEKGTSAQSGFPVALERATASCQHCTVGCDVQISGDRIIALDTQAVGSISLLLDSAKHQNAQASNEWGQQSGNEILQQQLDMHLAVFLLSVCHVVLVLTEGIEDTSMWELMESAEMLANSLDPPEIASSSSQGRQPGSKARIAEVVFVHSRVPLDKCDLWAVQPLQRALDAFLGESPLAQRRHISYAGQGSTANCSSDARGANLYVLPEEQPGSDAFQEHLKQLCYQVLALPRRQMGPTSEKEWLSSCESTWHAIQESPDVWQYLTSE